MPSESRARRWLLIVVLAVAGSIAAYRVPAVIDAFRSMTGDPEDAAAFAPAGPRSLLPPPAVPEGFEPFVGLMSHDPITVDAARRRLVERWDARSIAPLLEVTRVGGASRMLPRAVGLLEEVGEAGFAHETERWWQWIWETDPGTLPGYAAFKSQLYSVIDPRFADYFDDDPAATIRLDEIRWGGVRRDGIPPLDHPETVAPHEAAWLDDTHVVFGVEVDGVARAYPKRILAWHEMVKDRLGDVEINGVYCTLCGSMIVYDATHEGVHHDLGTSGFLYRSNKLMYDRATASLWWTTTGEPVVGPLVGRGIRLEPRSVVTTTWGEWRRRHPDTRVLSIETGHDRDYGEGVAYRRYFATDDLMFSVPELDDRLLNKDEVLAIRFGDGEPLAFAAAFLDEHPLHHDRVHDRAGAIDFVVITDESGANRVYETGGRRFARDAGGRLVDGDGVVWHLGEDALVAAPGADPDAGRLRRLPAHRAFWFGWFSAHPETRLVR